MKISISSVNDLEEVLLKYNINVSKWTGLDGSKTIEDLYTEIECGETQIHLEDNNLIRVVNIIKVDVRYNDLVLKENSLVYSNGYIKHRDNDCAISEKRLGGEDSLEAAVRGVKEEIGLVISKERFEFVKECIQENESNSYIGLKSRYTMTQYRLVLNDKEFNEDGYIEKQKNRDIYFKWVG